MSTGLVYSRRPKKIEQRQRSRVIATRKISYLTDARGLYRVFNAAVYRFYRSQLAPPVEGDTPFDTNATLPDTPTNTYGDGTWYLSMSRYNGIYDSGFLPLGLMGETYLRIDIAGGVEVLSPPAGPLDWQIEAIAGGVVRITAVYVESGSLRADDWAIAYTVNGSTPPEDTPDETEPITADGLAVLVFDLPGQANGTTVKVRLQTRRLDSSYTYSENSEVKTVTADALGPTAVQSLTAVQTEGKV